MTKTSVLFAIFFLAFFVQKSQAQDESTGSVGFEMVRITPNINYKAIGELQSLMALINQGVLIQGGTPFQNFEEFQSKYLMPKDAVYSFVPHLELYWKLKEVVPLRLVLKAGLSHMSNQSYHVGAQLRFAKSIELANENMIRFDVRGGVIYDRGISTKGFVRTLGMDKKLKQDLLNVLGSQNLLGSPVIFGLQTGLFYQIPVDESSLLFGINAHWDLSKERTSGFTMQYLSIKTAFEFGEINSLKENGPGEFSRPRQL